MREFGLLGLEKRRLWGDVIVVFQYLKGVYRKDKARLFTRPCSNKTRGNGFKFKECRLRLDMGERNLFHEGGEALEFPRETVDAPSLMW